APYFKRILLEESAGNHGDHGMILNAARTVDSKVAAGRGLQTMLLVISPQGEFGHQLGPSVRVVRVVGPFRQVLREKNFLADVGLQKIRIDASGRGKNNFVNFR